MRLSLNRVTLIGNLATEPEIRTTANGRMARLRVITSKRYKDRESGEQREQSQGHDVVVFVDRLVDLIDGYARKGNHVMIEGELETRKWKDKDDLDRYSTEVVIRPYGGSFNFVGSDAPEGGADRGGRDNDRGGRGNDGDRGGNRGRDYDDNRGRDNDRGRGNDRGGSSGGSNYGDDDLDDDIPF